MTCGPYRPISLISYVARLSSVQSKAYVSSAPVLSPSLKLDITISGHASAATALQVTLKNSHGAIIRDERVAMSRVDHEIADHLMDVIEWQLDDLVSLWWPVGYGKQDLYDVDVLLLGQVCWYERTGFILVIWYTYRVPPYWTINRNGLAFDE